jgi:hypothetical protein
VEEEHHPHARRLSARVQRQRVGEERDDHRSRTGRVQPLELQRQAGRAITHRPEVLDVGGVEPQLEEPGVAERDA